MIQAAPSTGDQIAERLVEIQHQIDLLLLEQSALAAEFAAGSCWDDDGSASPIHWLRWNCHLTARQASDRIAVGEAAIAQSKAAVAAGEIGFTHLAIIARTALAVGDHVDEGGLLEIARKASPGKLYFRCQQYRHSIDARGYGQEQGDAVENRHLNLTTCEDGCLLLSGMLDPVGGAAVRTALEPLARRSEAGDTRDLAKRHADALVELVCGGRPATLQITASVETVKAAVGATGGENEFTLPIAAGAVQRLACDCSVMRVLLDQESVIVDVGRSKRVIAGPARRALMARDGHCQWRGCERPASRCDGHHLVHWIHGGSTDLSNLVLLCHRHHWLVHEGGWQLARAADGDLIPVAPTITFGAPRAPD